MEEKKEEKKHRKRNGKPRRVRHHPWDEVSLPGAGTSPTEQQTILEVLNNKQTQQQQQDGTEATPTETATTTAGTLTPTTTPSLTAEGAAAAGAAVNVTNDEIATSTVNVPLDEVDALSADDLVSSQSTANTESSSSSNESATSQIPNPAVTSAPATIEAGRTESTEREASAVTQRSTNTATVGDTAATKETITIQPIAIDRQCSTKSSSSADQGHVLDIESHLIETYNDYQATDDSVGINELLPQQDELTVGSSKVGTDVNVRTVIEVEPVGAISKKPVETLLPTRRVQRAESESENLDDAKVVSEIIAATLNGKEDAALEEKESVKETETEAVESVFALPSEPSDAIKATAERLVNEIEREVLDALRKGEEAQKQTNTEGSEASERQNQLKTEATEGSATETQAPNNDAEAEETCKIEEKTEQATTLLDEISNSLTQKVDAQLSEVTSILKSSKSSHAANGDAEQNQHNELKIVNVPSPKTPSDEEERKQFLESLPHLDSNAEAQKLADDCKREYYQSLKKYLIQSSADRPPVPLQTYRWEDLRRAKERGGYPWTHLYKRPLGPDEQPEIVLLLRKSQEFRFLSESPKSLKKVRIDEQVIVKQPERYIQELSEAEEDYPQSAPEDEETHSLRSESISCVSDSILATGKPRKSTRLDKIRGYLRRRKGGRTNEDAQSLPCASISSSRRHSQENLAEPQPNPQILVNGNNTEQKHCYPIMKKLKSMADRQKKRLNIKRIHLGKDEKIVLGEETKILKLKKSPKAERGEIPHFIEKQDSDDVLEIMELDESPSRKRRDDGRQDEERPEAANGIQEENEQMDTNQSEAVGIVVPDEIIEIPKLVKNNSELPTTGKEAESTENLQQSEEIEADATAIEADVTAIEVATTAAPPKKAPRLRREHVYEEIESDLPPEVLTQPPTTDVGVLELGAIETLKESLAKQDSSALKHIEEGIKPLPLDRMGSSEEDQVAAATAAAAADKPTINLLAPLSSVDSASSDEDRNRAQLSPVTEESDAASVEDNLRIVDDHEPIDLKPAIKKEVSPAPSDKKVTFSHVEDEAEPHREDIELPTEVQEATQEAAQRKRWTNMSDHEYEPIAAPAEDEQAAATQSQTEKSELARNIEKLHEEIKDTEDFQRDLEERYFSSEATTPRTESRTDYEIHTSQVDSSALEELPLKPENRKKGFMASAQDRTRKMQAGLKNQAGKIKTKLRAPAKKPASSSPKAKERKRFKAPEFSKIKMPEIKRPDMSKLKDFKRPEFTKFNKPDMSKFKLPEKFTTLKLKRSKSFKENETQDEEMEVATQQIDDAPGAQPQKKKFEFNFGTYPRAFRKKKPVETQASLGTDTDTAGVSVIPSTETQPSQESSNSPQGDRGPGPVRSRWADKFSDVSYNDSEGSRYRRYGSEQESFDRESSLERRMKDDLEETESEVQEMGILGGVADTKQFAEFDEENRAIHEISKMRAGEFRRRPMVHQDSDLRSEDSKDVEGWTEKEIEKNKLLRKAELEAEASYLKYPSDDVLPQETQSTASSGKKVVMEEIDDDEFFLRKRGVSEDNIELRQYISNAIREGYDRPINALEHVGQVRESVEYRDYDIPPPKPKRLHKSYRPQDVSQDLESQRSEYGDDLSMSQNGSDYFNTPKRPLRKGRSRSKYSMDSQDFPVAEHIRHEPYFDDDEEYLRPPRNSYKDRENEVEMNDLDIIGKQVFPAEPEGVNDGVPPPQAPRRRKRDTTRDNSMDKDSYMNGFGGRSVSNSRLQPTDDVIVYRTEHEYPIPLAETEKFTPALETRKSRATSRYDEDDRTSRGADSLGYDDHEELQADRDSNVDRDKYMIDMMENDGYAIVRKEHLPKPTPPARRKKFSRSPGERFASISSGSAKSNTPPPERPPPPRSYTPSTIEEPVPPRRKSATSLEVAPQILEDDYEEPEALQQERPESPRDLQSGAIINKMKFRPLPPPPRPPREKRQRAENKSSAHSAFVSLHEREFVDDKIATSSTADSYDPTDVDLEEEETRLPEVEVSTQTDPLPDDFECEEFEITEDMRIIEPRINSMRKTLDELLREEELKIKAVEEAAAAPLTEEEQLTRGLQRFRDANQRSMSERSRASSQADRSKSQSRPPTPSAVVIERRISTPIPSQQAETMLEASLIVRPIDDLDLEEEALRREGLLTDSEQQSKSDVEASTSHDEEEESKHAISDYSVGPSSEELNAALDELRAQADSNYEEEKDEAELSEYASEYEKHSDEGTLARSSYERYIGGETSGKEDEEELELDVAETKEERLQEIHTDSERYEASTIADEDEQKMSEIEEAPTEEEDAQKISEIDEAPTEEEDNVAPTTAEEVTPTLLVQDKHFTYEEKAESLVETRDTADAAAVVTESVEEATAFEEPPLPPPRRKSTTALELPPTLTLVEETWKELTPVPTLAAAPLAQAQPQLPAHLGELEVERLRVHALQAGQIMVSQLHGAQISAEELECKSGNLIVKNIALPDGFIEDIVERVRTTDRSQLLTVETQTSLQASSEERSPAREVVPPPKPPRQRDLEASKRTAVDTSDEIALQQLRNYDEETQTDPLAYPTHMTVPPPVYATTEYLQSLPPLGFYNLRRADEPPYSGSADGNEANAQQRRQQHHHHHHHHRHHRRCDSSCSECEDYDDLGEREETRSRSHSRRSRSSTRPPNEPQTVVKAGKQFMSACSLSLVQLLNRVTAAIRGAEADKNVEGQVHHIPTLLALFVVISFTLIVYMLAGRSVHTHHWDFFNPPGNGARQS
ncbi:uro-adherence factor A isoform X3 [Bactrocera oleae]|uniref:uro-adherence factor A isoform X3 n=1 Tax=Bactrocera oleae TaxID=104688 RepID=UPI00387EC15D